MKLRNALAERKRREYATFGSQALCEQYWRACQLGRPVSLPAGEMQTVLARFASYGQQDPVA
ncbi:MAG: hypothetical protein LBO00_02640 [Zoogloeaceae bacterium]|nr:hypothetical protein [Zoogloeaceae bacterium]